MKDLDIEVDKNCKYDFLNITDESTNKQLAHYCAKLQNVVLKSSGNSLRLHFKSDSSNERKGFNILWQVIGDSTGNYDHISLSIYVHFKFCIWLVCIFIKIIF